MIQIVVITHGELAAGLLQSARMIVGDLPGVHSISFAEGIGHEEFEELLALDLPRIISEGPTLIFCDILGGTPFKTAARYAFQQENVSLIYGVNLPLFVDAALSRADDLPALVERLVAAAPTTVGLAQF